MKKVLHVIGGLKRGGAETMLMNLYQNIDLENLQFDFLVFYKVNNDYEDKIKKMGGKIILLSKPNIFSYHKYISNLRKVIRDNGPYDVIHCHVLFNSAFSLFAAKLEGIKIRVAHAHSAPKVKDFSLVKRIYCIFTKNIIDLFANKYVACSKEAAQVLYKKEKIDRIIYLKNAIYIDDFLNPDENKKTKFINEYGIEYSVLNIVSVARFYPVKNHQFMIEIAKKLKDKRIKFKMYFVGDGELIGNIENLVKINHLEKDVYFLGVRNDVSTILSAMDIFIMPSFYEGLPVSLIEAQTAGLYCLVSEEVSRESDMGLNSIEFLPIGDLDKWVSHIENIKTNYKENDKQVIRTKITENGYNIENQVLKLLDIYEID